MPAHLTERQGAIAKPTAAAYVAALDAISGLVSHWRLGETSGSAAADRLGADAGTYSGGTLGVTGLITGDTDKAFDTSGSGYVDLGSTYCFNATTGNTFTVVAWMKPTTLVANGIVVGTDWIGNSTGWGIETRTNGSLFPFWHTNSVGTSGLVAAGTRYCVALGVSTSGAFEGWKNGVSLGTSSSTLANGGFTHVYIGKENAGHSFNGVVDDVAMFNRRLSTAEVLSIYTAGQ